MFRFHYLILIFFIKSHSMQQLQVNYDDLEFDFIYGNRPDAVTFFKLNETEKLLNHSHYNKNNPTEIYFYGYTENLMSNGTKTIVDSYIERGNNNVLVLEWSEYNQGIYNLEVIPNMKRISDIVGKALLDMQSQGFDLNKFHLIGHSLGGQMAGYVGRSVYKKSNNTFKLKRITALDPAGPFFYDVWSYLNKPLSKDDAVFVDVIHTDKNYYGAPRATGTADFWPNGGTHQPGCPPSSWNILDDNSFCSHRRSWEYYAESVRSVNKPIFNSFFSISWETFVNNGTHEQSTEFEAFMGIDADPRMKGEYFLQTNAAAPFNRGKDGTTYKP